MKFVITMVASVVLLALGSQQVAAQSCASPLPIFSDSSVSGDTCAANNELAAMGGFSSPQNDIIYSYTANAVNASIAVSGPANAAAYLLPACTTSTGPIDFGVAGVPLVVDGTDSPDGSTMYINMTFDGSTAAGTCGEVTFTVTGTLPVELKGFSVM